MLRLNKNYPKNDLVCHTCCVGKDFGFGGRWKVIIFGRETGKSKKTPIYFGNFCSQEGKCCSISLFCGGAGAFPILLCPFLPISLSPFASLLLPGGSAFPLCSPAPRDALPPENLQELLLLLPFPAGPQDWRADGGSICFPSPCQARLSSAPV